MNVKSFPVKEIEIRPGETHLFCGRGCEQARLAKRVTRRNDGPGLTFVLNGIEEKVIEPDGKWYAQTTLEPRYTNAAHPSHAPGSWWRQQRGGYKGKPRGRDARRVYEKGWVYQRGKGNKVYRPSNYTPSEGDRQVVRELTAERRDHDREFLQPGEHTVICYRCGYPASIRVDDLSPMA